ncbi:hypothetical protein QV08_01350 [Gallibacterium salpingitidis]|uniref:Lipoprotein n=1 Tax=Gallibacterium salpingitidis TaxID=505341 RepID=A0AB36E2P4_9PAST|nr:hypothetical protein [Gallibacterium salpingitidis]OBX09607.1 hypothetical protein QV08_01350 [Gallibacterium salpingitidis]OBX10462.1 hypothetical protein QV09_05905 [Gallibacterium salpingitidis]
MVLGRTFVVSVISSIVLVGCNSVSNQYRFNSYGEAEAYLEKEYMNKAIENAMVKTFSLNTEKDRLSLYTLTKNVGNQQFEVKMRIYGFDSYDLESGEKYYYKEYKDMSDFMKTNKDVLPGQFYTKYYGKAIFNCTDRKLNFTEGFVYYPDVIQEHPNIGTYFTDVGISTYKVKQIEKSGAPSELLVATSPYHRPPADYILFKAFKDKVPAFIDKYCSQR